MKAKLLKVLVVLAFVVGVLCLVVGVGVNILKITKAELGDFKEIEADYPQCVDGYSADVCCADCAGLGLEHFKTHHGSILKNSECWCKDPEGTTRRIR